MDKVTETPLQLFTAAAGDITQIVRTINDWDNREFPIEFSYGNICFNATQAIEKYLKGYIIENNKTIDKSHNLNYLREYAQSINKEFEKIEEECLLLNEFTPAIRYGGEQQVTEEEIGTVFKALVAVYNFEPLKALRERLEEAGSLAILPDIKDKLIVKK